jgi:3-oxoacyl-(acyl-carrier-protein) synthase
MEDAGIYPNDLTLDERRGIGVELGTGGGGLSFTEKQYERFHAGHTSQVSVYTIPSSTHGGLSSELSMRFGLRGLSHIISTGCTSSTDAIAYAAEHIAVGRQEAMLTGGVDAACARHSRRLQFDDRADEGVERRAAARRGLSRVIVQVSFWRRRMDLRSRRKRACD